MNFKNGYKAVFFDLDGTLRHNVPNHLDSFTEKARELGLKVNAEQMREAGRWEHYYWAQSKEMIQDFKTYAEGDEFWQHYTLIRLQAIGANPAEAEALAPALNVYMKDEYHSENWVPPELHQILPSLREAGLKLGVLSNRRSPFDDELRELNLTNYFDFVKAAGQIGSWKPDPAIFTPLLEHFSLAAADAVYIGDNYYADVVGARAAGLEPVLYDPRGIFPEPDCTRITSFTELLEIL